MAAAIGALVAWAVTPPVTPRDLVRHAWDSGRSALDGEPAPPPDRVWIVDAYMRETEEAGFWSRPPTMFAPSAALMRARFHEFDPRRAHRYRRTDFKLWIPGLVRTAPLFAGLPIEVLGRIAGANVLAPPMSAKAVEWVVQLAPVTMNDGLVYCRVTAPLSRRFVEGRYLVARGTVIGAGNVDLTRGGRAPAAYMACSAVRKPYGGVGKMTALLERTGIDLVAIRKKARSERDFGRLIDLALLRAAREELRHAQGL
jgi:hypothetical protein